MTNDDVKQYLREYDGPSVRLMEVCGTHTAAISHCGIAGMLSPKIRLISGPGCPVCVTVTAYIDRLVELSMKPEHVVVSFGDMLRVTGSSRSLNDAKAEGGHVQMVYSPMDTLALAQANPEKTYVFAAVGFETTTPIYAILLEEAIKRKVGNLKILTSLKTMPSAIDWICKNQTNIDGFIAPGHVSVITGSDSYIDLSKKFGLPFVVAGFEGEQILSAIYALVKLRGKAAVKNFYPTAVTARGNELAQQKVQQYFVPCNAAWRGLGSIADSGMRLRDEYLAFDAGSMNLDEDKGHNPNCRCAKVLIGETLPNECPLFGRVCTPQSPQGACMVSTEGSCHNYYVNKR